MLSQSETLSNEEREILLAVARSSIENGLRQGCALSVNPADYAESLRSLRATFVTLAQAGKLRGCIGALEATKSLVADVADHAFAAAFEDPRFAPLSQSEWPQVNLHIAVLSPPEPMSVSSEEDLLEQLRPGVDGLILSLGERQATFLPSVWETLPDPYLFVAQLKQKAGLPLDFWSEDLRAARYTTESFGDEEASDLD